MLVGLVAHFCPRLLLTCSEDGHRNTESEKGKKPGIRQREKRGQIRRGDGDGDGGAATRGEAPPPLPHRPQPLPGGRGRAVLCHIFTVRRRPSFPLNPLFLLGLDPGKGACSYSRELSRSSIPLGLDPGKGAF